jgi:hypothetical protein
MLSVACCVSSVAFSPSYVACLLLSVAHFPVVPCTLPLADRLRHCCPLDRACCTHSVACSPLPVACCPPRCPMPRGVRCLSPGPRRISSRCMCCAASRLLHDARPLFACCLLSVACPILHVVRCLLHRDSQRRRARSTSRRTDSSPQSHTTLATRSHARTPSSVCSRSRRPLKRSIASAAAGIRAPEASRRNAETVAACLRS